MGSDAAPPTCSGANLEESDAGASRPACVRFWRCAAGGLCVLACLPATAQDVPFATRVMQYAPAPGQFVQDPQFNDPCRALDAPTGGGTLAAQNTGLVTLGGFGGTITLGFDHRVMNHPKNPLGLDAIVFGNAVYVAGNRNRRFAEAATIEISLDANGNGLADDAWYIVRGPQMASPPAAAWASRTWDDNIGDPTFPPHEASWVPPGRAGRWMTWGVELPTAVFGVPVVQNPLGLSATTEGIWGVADYTPTLILGDMDGDNQVDDPAIPPHWFYTVPDDPFQVGITPGSGGGDAFDIAWAVDPATGAPANLPGFDFIRLTTAVDVVGPLFGEVSAEIDAVADVRADYAIRAQSAQIVVTP